MLAVLFGLLMVASIDGPRPHFNATRTSMFLGAVSTRDLMQQGGGGSRKSVGADELEVLAVSSARLGQNQKFGVSKQMAANCNGVEA